MERIAVVTDSTADLSSAQVAQHEITVVPITIHFGLETFADGVDLSAAAFYRRLTSTTELPKTSQPSPQVFADVYRNLLKSYDSVLSIHLSGRLSGTLNSARLAAKMVEGNVIPVDTKTASQGIGRSVLIAAEAIKRGWSVSDTLNILNESIRQTFSVFSVDTLEYLARNGRIGKAASYLGTLLRIKPILYADSQGSVAPYAKVRGKTRVIPRLVEAAKDRFIPGSAVHLSVVHSGAAEAACILLAKLQTVYTVVDSHIGMVGPAIGAHIGPGALGLMIQPSFDSLASSLASGQQVSV